MSTRLPKSYSLTHAARILGVSQNTLRRWDRLGKIASTRTSGGHRRFSPQAIKDYKLVRFTPKPPISIPPSVPVKVASQTYEGLSIPSLYKSLHIRQKLALGGFIYLLLIVGMLGTLFKYENIHQTTFKSIKELSLKNNPQVLQASDEASNVSFNVNVESTNRENSLFEKDVTILGNLNIGTNAVIDGTLTLAGSLVVPAALEVTGETTLADTLTLSNGNLILGDGGIINIGGSGSTTNYNVIGDTTSGASASMTSDDDLYIEGNLEVDGTIIGTLSGTFNPGLTAGAVLFQDPSAIAGDATNFFWDTTNKHLRIGSGGAIVPSVNIGSDLGSTSLKWNNLYVSNINSDSALTLSGQGIFTYDPADTTFAEASVRINPTAPAANEQMLGIGQGGEQRVGIDAEGDLTIGYDGAAGSSIPNSSNPLNIYGHGTDLVLGVNTAGTLLGGSTNSVRLQAGGTTTGSAGNSSIFFLDSGGTVRGRFDTKDFNAFGDGSDGAVSITASKNINTESLGADSDDNSTYADGIAYKVDSNPTGTSIVTTDTPSGLSVGDEILLINLKGSSTDYADVGNYEFLQISAINSTTITTTTTIQKSYDGTTFSNQKVIIQRIPQYTNVTLSSSGSITASAWDNLTTTPTGDAGYRSGIVAFRATGLVSLASGTSITASQLGYRGGNGGETYNGQGGAGGGFLGSGSSGQGGGGGGAGDVGSGTGATGSTGSGTTGGTGGDAPCGTTTPGSGTTGGGGGGGASGGGGGGAGGGGGGGYGTTAAGGTGGAPTTWCGAGGGGGGGSYGAADLSDLFFGSAGGGGNAQTSQTAEGAGGDGGGIVFVIANTISNTGTISANGETGTNATTGAVAGGGGGAGGSIFIATRLVNNGTSGITASAGSGGTGAGTGGTGATGSVGRIRIEYTESLTGSTSPTASTDAQISSNATTAISDSGYGTLFAGEINTTSADLAEKYPSNDRLTYGEVVSLDTTTPGYVKKSSLQGDSKLLGIVSSDPGVVLGSHDSEEGAITYPIALSGRVPVIITSASQPITIGDFLTSSTEPGKATKAIQKGPTVAKALEDWKPGDAKTQIMAFVHLGYYDPLFELDTTGDLAFLATPDEVYPPQTSSEATQSAEVATVSAEPDKIQSLETEINILKADVLQENLDTLATFLDVVISGKLDVGILQLNGPGGTLNSIGKLKLQSLALDSIEFLGGLIEMDTNGNLSLKKGILRGNTNFRGNQKLETGHVTARVDKVWDEVPQTVVLTPDYDTPVWVTDISENGFTINVETPPSEDATINWMAVW